MKTFLIVLTCILALILLTLAAFGISYQLHSSASTETLGKEETIYTTKDNGCRIANIPYEEYLTETKPGNGTVPEDLAEENVPEENAAAIENVTVENIKADKVELPSAVTGIKGHSVNNITLKGFDIYYRDTEQNLSVKKRPDENSMSGYPEITRVSHIYFISHQFSRYWSLPCYGLFSRNADNLTVEDFNCRKRTADTRECFMLQE